MLNFRKLVGLLLLFFLCSTANAQQGEWFTGISISPGIDPHQFSAVDENWSAGAGLFIQYQLTDRFGLVLNPNFRHFSKQYQHSYCTVFCNSTQYNTLETSLGISYRLFQQKSSNLRGYVSLGYSFQQGLFQRTKVYDGPESYFTLSKQKHYINGHAPFIALDMMHAMGERYGLSWGFQYSHPISNYEHPSNQPLLLLNVRFGRRFN